MIGPEAAILVQLAPASEPRLQKVRSRSWLSVGDIDQHAGDGAGQRADRDAGQQHGGDAGLPARVATR